MAFHVAKKTADLDAHNLAVQVEFLLFNLLKSIDLSLTGGGSESFPAAKPN
jgi:hypothetical protein